MANIDLTRSALINYKIYAGDSFIPGPVEFDTDDIGTAEDFTGCTFLLTIKLGSTTVATLTQATGIDVTDNVLQYDFTGYLESLDAGVYTYTVQKTDASSVDVRIQHGTITLIK